MPPIENPPLATELFAIMAIMLYGVVLSYALPEKRHFLVNVACAITVAILGLIAGLSLADMGLAPSEMLHGVAIALVISIVIAGSIYASAHVPRLRSIFRGSHLADSTGRQLAYAIGVRIPLSTALLEETLFRGVLLGLLLQVHSTWVALLVSSALFGIWHILPTVAHLEHNEALATTLGHKQRVGAILLTVLTTGLAGAAFSMLRLWSGSLLTPWLVHWTINASGALASSSAAKRHRRKQAKNT